MTNPGGQWVSVAMPGGQARWDWVPADQPPSPDGRPGVWHVVGEVPGAAGRWEFFPASAGAGWGPVPESLAPRARLATIFVGLAMAASAVVIVLDIVQIGLLSSFLDGTGTPEDVQTRDSLSAAGGLLWLAASVPAWVFFIRWLHLAYRNLDAFAPGVRRHKVGWAIGAWFVPFLNLWRPKQIVDQVHRGTGGAAFGLITAWWATWLVASIAGNGAARGFFAADSVEEYRTTDIADAVVSGLEIGAGVLAILVIRAVTCAYERRAAELGQYASAGAPPGGGW